MAATIPNVNSLPEYKEEDIQNSSDNAETIKSV
jgi:hypothetical protein